MGPIMELKRTFSESKLLVHLLVCLFGIASWIDINGTWVELPILVTSLPEGWTLPSFIIIASQIANIGPIIFAILVVCFKDVKLEKPVSAIIIVIGMTACFLLAFFWDRTSYLFGETRSTALLCLSFALSTVDCTSSLAFLAFMTSLKSHYLPSYYIGEGLSGMLPSLIALGQGAGSIVCVNGSQVESNFTNGEWFNETVYSVYPMYEEPRFSVQVFYLIVFGLMTVSLLSFIMLVYHPYCKREHVLESTYNLEEEVNKVVRTLSKYRKNNDDGSPYHYSESKEDLYKINNNHNNGIDNPAFELKSKTKEEKSKSKNIDYLRQDEMEDLPIGTYLYLLFITFFINMQITTFLLSIQTYTSLPYGLNTYHLSAIITNIANPVACIVALVLPVFNIAIITSLTISGSVFGAYLMVIAFMSPHSPLVGTDAGGPLAVTSWALASFLLTYAKVATAGRLRRGGRRPMLWCGALTQIGATIGAIAAFLLVNVFHILIDAPSC